MWNVEGGDALPWEQLSEPAKAIWRRRANAALQSQCEDDVMEDYSLGQAQGRRWALTQAERSELWRMANWIRATDWGRGVWDSASFRDQQKWPTASYWMQDSESRLGDQVADWDRFLHGFVGGAARAFEEIEAAG